MSKADDKRKCLEVCLTTEAHGGASRYKNRAVLEESG